MAFAGRCVAPLASDAGYSIPEIQQLASSRTVHFRTPNSRIDHPLFLTFVHFERLTDVDKPLVPVDQVAVDLLTAICKTLDPARPLSRQIKSFISGFFLDGGPNGKGRAHS
jgi:hypothetical protein